MQLRCGQHMVSNGVDQRTQQCAGRADPTRQLRAIQVDAFAGVDDGLAVQRQMVGELRYQDVRQQTGAGDAVLDWPAWCRRLDDGVAVGARQLGEHMADHAEAGRRELQLLGHVLAQRPQAGQASAEGVYTFSSRGRCPGNGRRTDFLRGA